MKDKHGHKLIEIKCKNCGNTFWGRVSQTTCSLSCAGKMGIVSMLDSMGLDDRSKENNPNWKGGSSMDWNSRARRTKELNPEKVRARGMAANARRDGRLVKKPCEICGSVESVESHHDDYSKPLEVRWLCKKHHDEITWGNKQSQGEASSCIRINC